MPFVRREPASYRRFNSSSHTPTRVPDGGRSFQERPLFIEAKDPPNNASRADTRAYTAPLFCALNQEVAALEEVFGFLDIHRPDLVPLCP